MPALAVVVPAGGRSRRLADDKRTADLDGRTLLDRTLDGLPADALVVCVGPTVMTGRPVTWVRESPPHGGPLAAVEAGVALLPSEVVTVLLVGGDMPTAGVAVPALLDALAAGRVAGASDRAAPHCAVVADGTGRRQPLLAAWQRTALVGRLAALAPTAGRPLAALLDGVTVALLDDRWGAADDVDTPEDLESARRRLREPPVPPG